MKLKGISNKGFQRIYQNVFEPGFYDDDDEEDFDEDYSGLTLVLEDMDEDDMVLASVSHHNASDFAEHDQSIRGTNWETDGSSFAYAIFPNEPDLLKKLNYEYGSYGMKIDDSMYTPM